ncbi:hypothetical protein IMG5_168410 [Ichthyophthirius multifiliis]|uniref:Importin N-terminal domain-containing protein n=1 Tax=Ichthyophthirius multifiliis TaxID=5932 RepID=G0R138_ICHMU|nr:hypothetical protein IMG5_168410 [Ichthyophthirius multifiliis]EGR28805.1 hypothetical protein IMG5_168410 [Ichthyophthirius multifiliis]|eukprot:XP_004030041.1 hypothetical protein IMG5_168410 [Ichthyophthirius multifiliis]
MIADNNQLEISVRQFAVTNIKINIKKYWSQQNKNNFFFSDEDKESVKQNLLEALIRSVQISQLQKLYSKIINEVCSYDFPEKWPYLLENIVQKLHSNTNEQEILGCLLALKAIFDNYEFELNEKRKYLDTLIPRVFPYFQKIIIQLTPVYNQTNAHILKPILKIFFKCINLETPSSLQQKELLSEWIGFFKLLIDHQMPVELSSLTENQEIINQRNKNILWKNKKWASQILTKIALRLANIQIIEKEQQPLAEWLIENHFGKILESFIQILFQNQQQFVGQACIYFAIKYINRCLQINQLVHIIQNQHENLLFKCLIPLIYLKQNDLVTFDEDPQEFIIQEEVSLQGNYKSNKITGMELIQGILKTFNNNNQLLDKFFGFISCFLQNKVHPFNPEIQLNLQIKDGLFFAIGYLKEQLFFGENNKIKEQMECFLQNIVLPEISFQEKTGIMRSRACQILGKFSFVKFKNQQLLTEIVQKVSSCLNDKILIVKYKAALSLNNLLYQKNARELIKGHLKELLEIYLKLMEEIDSEDLVQALQGIVIHFQENIGPYAYDLCSHLQQAFFKLKDKNNNENIEKEDYDGVCGLAANECLITLGKIITTQIPEDAFLKISQNIVLPIINECFLYEYSCFIDEGLYLLQHICFRVQNINQESLLWFYLGNLFYIIIGKKENLQDDLINSISDLAQQKLVKKSIEGWGFEYVDDVVVIIKNFIQKGWEVFLNGRDFFGVPWIEQVFSLVKKSYFLGSQDGFLDDGCLKSSIGLFLAILENQVVDQKVPSEIFTAIFKQALTSLSIKNLKKDVLVANMEVICLCFYYNCKDSFLIFQKLFTMTKFFKSEVQKQRLMIGFASILGNGLQNQELVGIYQNIMKECVALSNQILHLREENQYEDEDDEDEEDEENQNQQDKGDFQSQLQQQVDKLQKVREQQEQNNKLLNNEDDDEDEYNNFDRYEYNYNYQCPLDKFDEIIFLEQQLIKVAQNNAQFYQIIAQGLNEQEKAQLQENVEKAKSDLKDFLISRQQ